MLNDAPWSETVTRRHKSAAYVSDTAQLTDAPGEVCMSFFSTNGQLLPMPPISLEYANIVLYITARVNEISETQFKDVKQEDICEMAYLQRLLRNFTDYWVKNGGVSVEHPSPIHHYLIREERREEGQSPYNTHSSTAREQFLLCRQLSFYNRTRPDCEFWTSMDLVKYEELAAIKEEQEEEVCG
jgi:hypothetical protein